MNIFPTDSDITTPQRVKFGIDPTFPRLHLGHFIPLRLVKKMMQQGHQVTIVLGTFTAQLGDPSGRDTTRPILDESEVKSNSEQIVVMVKKLIGEVNFFCNDVLHSSISLPKFLRDIVSKFTLSHMISRNAFADRMNKNLPIAMHELLVPILQGLDSVHLNTEIEIGGQDQLFNFQIARKLQEDQNQKPQSCILLPIINGTDGRKMSKSLNNCIFLDEEPNDIFGKVISISDQVMDEWFPLLSDNKPEFDHPMENKKLLAFDIVRQLTNELNAVTAKVNFEETVQNKEIPKDISSVVAKNLLDAVRLIRSCSIREAKNLLKNAVKVNGVVITESIVLKEGQIIQIGKRDFAVVKTPL